MNSERLFKAIQFAAKAHDGQRRKGNNPAPYIVHPLFVGMELLRLGYDENTVIAGILHDILEDGFLELGRDEVRGVLLSEFGDRVVELIDAVTEPKDPNMTQEEKRRSWETRKEARLEQLKSAPIEARAVACVDMYANILEFKKTLESDGLSALNIFNVEMEKKLKHWEKGIQIFAFDTDCLHLSLLNHVRNILTEIQLDSLSFNNFG